MENEILEILQGLHDDFKEKFLVSRNFVTDELLDSFDIISLISILEEKYQINIDAFDIVPENFVNIDTIKELVRKSKKGIES